MLVGSLNAERYGHCLIVYRGNWLEAGIILAAHINTIRFD